MCGGTFPLTVAGGMAEVQKVPNHPQTTLTEEEVPEEYEPEERDPREREPYQQEAVRYDDEPWYYGYLERYAKSLKIEGYVIAAICAILATVWFFMFLDGGISTLSLIGVSSATAVLLSLLVWILSLVVIGAMLLLWLVVVAAILLAVDTARNIRSVEKRLGPRVAEGSGSKEMGHTTSES
jgi:hypothetical protein